MTFLASSRWPVSASTKIRSSAGDSVSSAGKIGLSEEAIADREPFEGQDQTTSSVLEISAERSAGIFYNRSYFEAVGGRLAHYHSVEPVLASRVQARLGLVTNTGLIPGGVY